MSLSSLCRPCGCLHTHRHKALCRQCNASIGGTGCHSSNPEVYPQGDTRCARSRGMFAREMDPAGPPQAAQAGMNSPGAPQDPAAQPCGSSRAPSVWCPPDQDQAPAAGHPPGAARQGGTWLGSRGRSAPCSKEQTFLENVKSARIFHHQQPKEFHICLSLRYRRCKGCAEAALLGWPVQQSWQPLPCPVLSIANGIKLE